VCILVCQLVCSSIKAYISHVDFPFFHLGMQAHLVLNTIRNSLWLYFENGDNEAGIFESHLLGTMWLHLNYKLFKTKTLVKFYKNIFSGLNLAYCKPLPITNMFPTKKKFLLS